MKKNKHKKKGIIPVTRKKNERKKGEKIEHIFEEIDNRIRPDIRVIKNADEMVKDINTLIKKSGIIAECVKGGSIAKETFLKDDYDIDLFIRFNKSYYNKDISGISENILKQICEKFKIVLERIHGSRDYFQFRIIKEKKILLFEVIPVILVHAQDYQQAENITDLSPEHVTWVKKYTTKNPKLIRDIRIAKQFCKANKVYGAESYINGFSGHIIDILIIYYGSFLNMLNSFSKYNIEKIDKPIIIDIEKNLDNPLKQLNKNKITPLIIVDPIQKDRNSAAALSKKRLMIFVDAAKKFLDKPSKTFFEIKIFNIEDEITRSLNALKISERNTKIILMDIDVTEGSKDVVGTKALKAYETIIEHMKMYGFDVLNSDWNLIHEEKRAEAYIITSSKISNKILHEGPPATAREDYKRFVEKHTASGHEILYKDGRAYTLVPRKFIDPKAFIEDLSKKEFISKKVKKIVIRYRL
ncbi:MAG: nucleotidyltransferase domain-containing protein [Candidatus Woesearchaeota archaeon]